MLSELSIIKANAYVNGNENERITLLKSVALNMQAIESMLILRSMKR